MENTNMKEMNNDTELQMPLSLIIEKAEKDITKAVNDTNLSPVLLEPIIRNIYDQVVIGKRQQIASDRKAFDESKNNDK